MRVVITIEGAQADVLEQEPDEQVQFSTDGEYTCVAVLKRTGAVTSRMVFAPGTRNTFLYQTPYGTSTVGLETQRYRSTLGERGGVLELLYVVDFDHACANRNRLRITVREQ